MLVDLKFPSSDARLNEVFGFYMNSNNAQFKYYTTIEIHKSLATI